MSALSMNEKYQTITNLIAKAYETDDEEHYWKIIGELHKRGSITEFNAAKKLALSKDPKEREISSDILGQLGWSKKTYQHQSVSILIQLLSDNNVRVIASAAFSLGHRNDLRAVPYLTEKIDHQNSRVRMGIVTGLSRLENKIAIGALIKLSYDSDFDVRNWATFGLGSSCEMDTNELREALYKRVLDTEYEIRGEALVGLAMRNDDSILINIIKELEGEFNGIWAVNAAKLLARPLFCKALVELKDRLDHKDKKYFENEINHALSACCHKSRTSNLLH